MANNKAEIDRLHPRNTVNCNRTGEKFIICGLESQEASVICGLESQDTSVICGLESQDTSVICGLESQDTSIIRSSSRKFP